MSPPDAIERLAALCLEMRTRKVGSGRRHTSPTLEAWAARIQAELDELRAQANDSRRWREVARRYQHQKTSESELFLATLRLEGNAWDLLETIVDAAIAAKGEPHEPLR